LIVWLRARQTPAVALVVLLVAASLVPAGTRILPLPGLGNVAGLGIPLALFAPVVIAIAVIAGLAAGEARLEAVAARPLPVLDAIYGASVAVVALGLCTLVWIAVGNAWTIYPLEAGRNALGYVGLALLGRVFLGPRAAGLVSVAAAVGAALLGSHADGSARWWAWPIADARDELSWILAFLSLALGVVATALESVMKLVGLGDGNTTPTPQTLSDGRER
jgi:hypothetical protein